MDIRGQTSTDKNMFAPISPEKSAEKDKMQSSTTFKDKHANHFWEN